MIKIFQINDVNPELLELQVASFKKYLQEDFELTVFSSEAFTHDPKKAKKVREVCRSLSIQVIDVQRDSVIEAAFKKSLNTSAFGEDDRYAGGLCGHGFNFALQWAWEKVISKEQGLICLLHADVLLMEPIKFTDYLREQPLCFKPIGSIAHMWDALVLADMSKLPDPEAIVWLPSTVEGEWRDTGGPTYYWLKAHPEVKRLLLSDTHISDDSATDFHPSRYSFFNLPDGKRVFHYHSGSRWYTNMSAYLNLSIEKSNEYHERKLAFTRKVIGITETK